MEQEKAPASGTKQAPAAGWCELGCCLPSAAPAWWPPASRRSSNWKIIGQWQLWLLQPAPVTVTALLGQRRPCALVVAEEAAIHSLTRRHSLPDQPRRWGGDWRDTQKRDGCKIKRVVILGDRSIIGSRSFLKSYRFPSSSFWFLRPWFNRSSGSHFEEPKPATRGG